MPARKPYQKMLKLPKHWKISRVEHAENGSRVDLWLKHEPHVFRCSYSRQVLRGGIYRRRVTNMFPG